MQVKNNGRDVGNYTQIRNTLQSFTGRIIEDSEFVTLYIVYVYNSDSILDDINYSALEHNLMVRTYSSIQEGILDNLINSNIINDDETGEYIIENLSIKVSIDAIHIQPGFLREYEKIFIENIKDLDIPIEDKIYTISLEERYIKRAVHRLNGKIGGFNAKSLSISTYLYSLANSIYCRSILDEEFDNKKTIGGFCYPTMHRYINDYHLHNIRVDKKNNYIVVDHLYPVINTDNDTDDI